MKKEAISSNQTQGTTAQIHGLSHDGRGIATIQQKTTFIAGGLPGEVVACKITQKRSHYLEAETIQVLSASEERADPACQHFGVCGGCSLQHMSAQAQINLKQQTLLDQLKHFGKVTPEEILPSLSALTTGYRRKARLGVKFVIKKNKLLVGFREKASNYLADLERCAILHPKVGEHFNELSQLVRSLESYRQIPQIEVAIGDTDAALVFRHLETLSATDEKKLVEFGIQYGFHIYLQPNSPGNVRLLSSPHKQEFQDSEGPRFRGDDGNFLRGDDEPSFLRKQESQCSGDDEVNEFITYTLPDENLEFLFHPLDFTQINLEINRLMVAQAINLLDLKPHETALDLFCGIGNFTLPIARRAKHVTGIEGGETMVARAKMNAAHNGIVNVDYFAANLDKPSSHATWAKAQYDKILLDPPRVGAKEVLSLIPQFAAKRIVYVSCNPATLARDAGELVHQYKYRLKKVGIMNMFPHTSHIEAMAVFDKEEQ